VRTLLFTLLGLSWAGAAARPNVQQPPYPPSPVVGGIEFDFASHRREAAAGDNWCLTWADDDHLYCSFNDGVGFGNGDFFRSDTRWGVARIEGDSESYVGYNRQGKLNAESPSQDLGYSWGMISVGGVLYSFLGTAGAPVFTSEDHGATWKDSGMPTLASLGQPGPFMHATVLNFGKDYAGARDTYVYVYAPTGMTKWNSQGTGVDLARVPKDRIRERAAYEYFKGIDEDGAPLWTGKIDERKPVFHYPGGVHWQITVAYNPGLARYLLCTNASPNNFKSSDVGKLEIFDAPEPWGPWTTAATFDNFGGFDFTYDYYFCPKWWRKDGAEFTLCFTGSRELYTFNTVNGRFIVKNRPPRVRLMSPNEGAILKAGSDVTLEAEAADVDGAVAKVEFFEGTRKLGEATAPPYRLAWKNIPEGTYAITARAVDRAGVAATASGVTACVLGTLPTVTVRATDPGASETQTGTDGGAFEVRRRGSAAEPLTVRLEIGGTATNGEDYAAIENSVTIPAGSEAATVPVRPVDDATAEGQETVVVTLVAGTGYVVGPYAGAQVTLWDNDPVPAVSLSGTGSWTTEGPFAFAVFDLVRTGGRSEALTVNFTVGGTATAGKDYEPLGSSFRFGAGAQTARVWVIVKDDEVDEGDETVVFTLKGGNGYAVAAPSTATMTIRDDDPVPPPTAVVNLDAAEEAGTFTVTRTGSTKEKLVVLVSAGGSASQRLGTAVVIPAGSRRGTLKVAPKAEGEETVELRIERSPSYGVGIRSTATLRIRGSNSPRAGSP